VAVTALNIYKKCVFNDAASSSDHMASNVKMTGQLESMSREAVVA
jgi:hypothetical protein